MIKTLGSINPTISEVKVKSLFLDDTRIKIDNLNKKILITSFFSKQKRGNIDGLYYTLWDKNTGNELLNATTVFSEEFRADVKGEGSTKTDFTYFIYQYQQKNIYYVMAAKIGPEGKIMGEVTMLDTTSGMGYTANNRIYTIVNSEDKQKLGAFKISTRNEKEHVITSCVFNKELNQLEKVRIPVPMPDKNDYLGEFGLDNEGNLVCLLS